MEVDARPPVPVVGGARDVGKHASVCEVPPVLLLMALAIVRPGGLERCVNSPVHKGGGVKAVSVSADVGTVLIVIGSPASVSVHRDIQGPNVINNARRVIMAKIAHRSANVGIQLPLVISSLACAHVRQDGRGKNAKNPVHRAPMARIAVKDATVQTTDLATTRRENVPARLDERVNGVKSSVPPADGVSIVNVSVVAVINLDLTQFVILKMDSVDVVMGGWWWMDDVLDDVLKAPTDQDVNTAVIVITAELVIPIRVPASANQVSTVNVAPFHVLMDFTETVVDFNVTVSMARPVILLVGHVIVIPAIMGKIVN